jgi:hypothetical protein
MERLVAVRRSPSMLCSEEWRAAVSVGSTARTTTKLSVSTRAWGRGGGEGGGTEPRTVGRPVGVRGAGLSVGVALSVGRGVGGGVCQLSERARPPLPPCSLLLLLLLLLLTLLRVALVVAPRGLKEPVQNGYLLRRGGGQNRWHSLVNCNHGDSKST